MSKVILSLGSNIGDKETMLKNAIELLSIDCEILRISPIFSTEPWGNTNQENFYNMCIEIDYKKSPQELLKFINSIEAELGRIRDIHWGPRTIDIDIIIWENLEVNEDNLIIPHKYWLQRAFVIAPLMSLFPTLKVYGYDFTSAVYVLKDEVTDILSHQIC